MLCIKMMSRRIAAFVSICAAVSVPINVKAAPIVLDQFDDGVSFTKDNITPMPNNSWMCVNSTYGTEAAESTLDGSKAMKITKPGGKKNGLYALFPGVVPEDGRYVLRCKLKFHEEGTNTPFFSFMLGCTVNGGHRQGAVTIETPQAGFYVLIDPQLGILTSGNDSSHPSVYLHTASFYAPKDADIRVMLSTYHDYEKYSAESWHQSYILVDEVVLFPEGDEFPVSLSQWTLE